MPQTCNENYVQKTVIDTSEYKLLRRDNTAITNVIIIVLKRRQLIETNQAY